MRTRTCLWACGLCILVGTAPRAVSVRSWQTPRRSEIESHLTFLTSCQLQGRRAGTAGAELAALYISARFQAAGLAPAVASGESASFFQPFRFVSLRADTMLSTLSWTRYGRTQTLSCGSALTCIPGGRDPEETQASAVFCGYGLHAPEHGFHQLPEQSVAGRVVVAIHGQPLTEEVAELRAASPLAKAEAATVAGAAALIVVPDSRGTSGSLARWRSARDWDGLPCVQRLIGSEPLLPLFILDATQRDSLLGGFRSRAAQLLDSIDTGVPLSPVPLPQLMIRFVVVPEPPEESSTCNVLGVLGTGPPTVLVGAHYDHLGMKRGDLYPGADDNASGVAVLLETARALAVHGLSGGRVLFAAFGAEEQGQLGSLHYCRQPVVPLESTSLMICLDSVGRNGPDHYRKLHAATADPDKRVYVYASHTDHMPPGLLEPSYSDGKDVLMFVPSTSPLLRWGSDHWRFEKAGVPVLFFFSGIHGDYHRPTDTADKLDPAKLQLLAARVCRLAETALE